MDMRVAHLYESQRVGGGARILDGESERERDRNDAKQTHDSSRSVPAILHALTAGMGKMFIFRDAWPGGRLGRQLMGAIARSC